MTADSLVMVLKLLGLIREIYRVDKGDSIV